MTAFDLYSLKENLSNYLRDMFYPRNTFEGSLSGSLEANMIAQSFKPLATYHNVSFTGSIEVRSLSSYNDLVIDLCSSLGGQTLASSTISASEISSDFTWLRFSFNPQQDFETSSTYWLQFRSHPNTIIAECFEFTANQEYFLGTLYLHDGSSWSSTEYSLKFVLNPPNWIYPSYPKDDLNLFSFPRMAIDIVDRPRVVQRWIDSRLADYELSIAIVLYSRYLKELDQLLSYTDRALWKKRTEISGFRILSPAKISSVMIPRTGIFARVLNFVGVFRQTGE